jgi:hypothetical protein
VLLPQLTFLPPVQILHVACLTRLESSVISWTCFVLLPHLYLCSDWSLYRTLNLFPFPVEFIKVLSILRSSQWLPLPWNFSRPPPPASLIRLDLSSCVYTSIIILSRWTINFLRAGPVFISWGWWATPRSYQMALPWLLLELSPSPHWGDYPEGKKALIYVPRKANGLPSCFLFLCLTARRLLSFSFSTESWRLWIWFWFHVTSHLLPVRLQPPFPCGESGHRHGLLEHW